MTSNGEEMTSNGEESLAFGGGSNKIDPSVASKLPAGSRVTLVSKHGISFWTVSGRLDIELEDGTPITYFIKTATNDLGRQMMHGEYESMLAIYRITPDFVPQPIGWGTYETAPDTHFFLCEYRELTEELPDCKKFTTRLAALHQISQSHSPEKGYGFHVPTFNGNLSQDNGWEDTWEAFFVKGLRHMLAHEKASQGPNAELEALIPPLFEKVIPRLLQPLETGGRSIKPSLVHGDLWFGNTGVDADTEEPVIFDACCFWAHNEYELGNWRPTRNRLGPEYVNAYHSHFMVSAPEEDWDDRNALYGLRFNTQASGLFPQDPQYRELMIDEIRRLVDKYPNGFED